MELSQKQKERLGLEASASLLRDILIGNPGRSRTKAELEQHRHSLHGFPEHWSPGMMDAHKGTDYSEPFASSREPGRCQYQVGDEIPEKSHFCHGSIHVGRDFLEKKEKEREKRGEIRFPSNRHQFMSVPPLSSSTPPVHRKEVGGAPYYVGDTLDHQHQHRSSESSDLGPSSAMVKGNLSMSSHPLCLYDVAGPRAVGKTNFPHGEGPNQANNGAGDDLSQPEKVTNPNKNRGAKAFLHGPIPRQHPCCQCECHSSSERSNHHHRILRRRSTSRQGRSASASTGSVAGVFGGAKRGDEGGDAAHVGLPHELVPPNSGSHGMRVEPPRRSASSSAVAVNSVCSRFFDGVAPRDGQLSQTSRSGDGGDYDACVQLVNPKLESQGHNPGITKNLPDNLVSRSGEAGGGAGERDEDAEECLRDCKYEAVKRRHKVGRSPTQKLLNRSAMVLDQHRSPVWNGVSGVPGLGVSIPQRPRSACEFDQDLEWCSAPAKFEFFGAAKKLAEKAVSKTKRKPERNDSSSLKSNESSKSSSGAPAWAPHSLQTFSHLRLDLPRVKSSGESSSHRSSDGSQTYYQNGSHGEDGLSPNSRGKKKTSFRDASEGGHHHPLSGKKPPSSHSSAHHRPLHHSVSQSVHKQSHPHHPQHHHLGLSHAKSLAPHMHSPLTRSHQRKTFHSKEEPSHSISTVSSEQKRLSLNNRQHVMPYGKPDSYNPLSLPLYGNEIPRAPIPVPVAAKRDEGKSSSEEEDGGSSTVHYEVLNRRNAQMNPEGTPELISQTGLEKPHFLISDIRRQSLLNHPSASNARSPPYLDSSFGSGGGHDSTFDSVELPTFAQGPPRHSAQHYKVLNDRDGDYSYAYDCSLSPAFLIRYNEDHPPSRLNSDGENIYEEISEVKKLIAENPYNFGANSRSKSDEKLSSGSLASTKSSLNADSGVGLNPRKYSNDTLDFGPNKGAGLRHISRYSHDSSDSFGVSDSSDDAPLRSIESGDHHAWMKPSNHHPLARSTSKSFPAMIRSQEILHQRAMEQMRRDPRSHRHHNHHHHSPSPNGDKDSGIQDLSDGHDKRSSSVSKIKGLKFGFGQSRSKLGPGSRGFPASRRSESVDNRFNESRKAANTDGSNHNNNNNSHHGFIKRCLSKLPSIANANSSTKDGPIPFNKAESLKSSSSLDNISFSDEEPSNMQRFQRSRITSRWENIDEDED